MDVTFFKTAADFRKWLAKHHERADELWVGYYKKGSGKPSITWPESVDEALCFGWIDGIRKSIDDTGYTIRFTPRRPRSNWSAVNIKRVAELVEQGRMTPAGLAAFEKRTEARSGIYTYEQRPQVLDGVYGERLAANPKASAFFRSQSAWYQKSATWWVMSAKREETRQKRLSELIADSEAGRTLPPLTRVKKAK
jgi:uncharacterized protein YdeI (YjbR/CyaY-like superfamily)